MADADLFENANPFEDPKSMKVGNMDTQWLWHAAYRDGAKNMYRTTAQDMMHGRETFVKSTYPAGYGGHNPRLRHDVLFLNGDFDKVRKLAMTDVSRDAHPCFDANIQGVPGYCYNPRGAKKVPALGSVPIHGLKCPWAITKPQAAPGFRRAPPMTTAMRRSAHEWRTRTDGFPTLPRAASEVGFYEEPPSPAPQMIQTQLTQSTPNLPPAVAYEPPAPQAQPSAQKMMASTMGSFGTKAERPSLQKTLSRSMSATSTGNMFTLNSGAQRSSSSKQFRG